MQAVVVEIHPVICHSRKGGNPPTWNRLDARLRGQDESGDKYWMPANYQLTPITLVALAKGIIVFVMESIMKMS